MVKIMIIDDQPLLSKWLVEDLSIENYRILRTEDVDDIHENMRTFMPDILLLDIFFGGYERWDILHRIKLESPQLPVLLVGSYENFTHNPRIDEADGYVIKDIYTNKLEHKMKELLTRIYFKQPATTSL